jgi:hypothetical protein
MRRDCLAVTPGVMVRYFRRAAIVCALALAAACGRAQPESVDLLSLVPAADIRPVTHAPDAVRAADAVVGGDARPALVAAVPTRVTIETRMPVHAMLTTALAVQSDGPAPPDAGVAFHLGISDGRVYEALLDQSVLATESTHWRPVQVDLRRYAGWQWSLFYHPSSITWQLVFNTYPVGTAEHVRGVWAAPRIERRGQ